MPYKMVLVGYDGSKNAGRALSKAIEIAKESGGELRVAVVAETMTYAGYAATGVIYRQFSDETVQYARDLADYALDTAKTAGVAGAYASAEEGQPADMILTLASEYKADLIVVGRRGMSGLKRFLIGSVSSAVINNAKCDVLVVK